MRKYFYSLFIAVTVLGLASCQKEINGEDITPPNDGPVPGDTIPTNNTNTEVGVWDFVSVSGTVSQKAELSQTGSSIKGITTTSFTSQNNAGTVTFDSVTMTASGVTFNVNTSAKTYVYMNGTLYDSVQTPFNQTVPAQNASSGYKKIGADSLNFQDGGFLNVLTGGLLPSAPSGCKITFAGNIMKMNIVYDTITTQDYQGIPAKLTIHSVLVATLQKR
jgi:hypothetical protein